MSDTVVKIATCDDNLDRIAEIIKNYREFQKVSNQDINEIKNFIKERFLNSDSKIFIRLVRQPLKSMIKLKHGKEKEIQSKYCGSNI
jgi:hypothetical protein